MGRTVLVGALFRWRRRALCLLAATLMMPAGAAMAGKFALVVGNAAYASFGTLANTQRDADTFAGFLSAAGFSVSAVSDASSATLAAAVQGFAASLKPDDVAVFYFAGHAVLSGRRDYLTGVDAHLATDADVAQQAISVDQVVGLIAAKAALTMAFIDAARGERLVTSSAVPQPPLNDFAPNALVMFATSPGQIAYDGIDGHSLFAGALLKRLAESGSEIRTAFQHVAEDVQGSTFKQQTPQLFSSLGNDFYFRPGAEQQVAVNRPATPVPVPAPAPTAPVPTPAVPPPAAPPAQKPADDDPGEVAKADFAAAQRMGTVRGWMIFLFRHPAEGDITTNAKLQLTRVSDAQTAGKDPKRIEADLQLTPDSLQAVQEALNLRGLNAGTPDGRIGRGTRNAITELQRANGRTPTGYLDTVTLALLGAPMASVSGPLPQGRPARTYRADDLFRIEGDPRLSSAVRCLGSGQMDYGFFGGHLYVAFAQGLTYDRASQLARRCGGYLASITSKAENDFVLSMIAGDPAFFGFGSNEYGAWIGGPNFGLRRERSGKDPKAGWVWDSGEPMKYANWAPYQPDNFQGVENIGGYWQEVPRGTKVGPNTVYSAGWNDSSDGDSSYIYEFP